jgi:hypothetical protein
MDDGFEGFMTPHVNRDGIPVCHKADVCGVINTDQFFASNRSAIWPAGKRRLTEFFQSATTSNFLVIGHTDNRASDKYNMRLSKKRADAVARVAKSAGVNVAKIRGYGERQPRTSNETAASKLYVCAERGTHMTIPKTAAAFTIIGLLSGCEAGTRDDKTIDYGVDKKHLSELVAAIWVDPNGCDHWIVDDGV